MKRHHVHLFLLLVLLRSFTALNGQQAMELQVVGAAGSVLANSAGNTFHFTVGELMVTEPQSDNNILSQGFHQIIVWQSVSDAELEHPSFNLRVYPNPGADFLKLETVLPVQVSLFDVHGRLIIPINHISSLATFDVRELAAGTYFLHAADAAGKTLKTYTILLID
ncbi:MAG: T9SS type A sorting domain-containing protein [Saprospiraceae bacterium]|nr:T9SS type A sorting domain-containing protein [Saprospiraceae bacterium]